jgi:threonine aldolase
VARRTPISTRPAAPPRWAASCRNRCRSRPTAPSTSTPCAARSSPTTSHFARSRLLCLENTQAGRATGPAYFARARALCDELGLALHLDGARLFNAAIATGCSAADIARHCDSVSVCLSKGLGAPVGSVLVGRRPFIDAARAAGARWWAAACARRAFLAAAGSHALTHHVDRLADDHAKAERLARWSTPATPAPPASTPTWCSSISPAELMRPCSAAGGHDVIVRGPRWVLHLDVSADDVERIGEILADTR